MMALFSALVYLIDRISSQRLKGFLSTLVLPSAFVAMDYISVITNPGGSFGAIATTQNSLPLLQLLSLTGMWGITFVIYWTASVVNWILDRNLAKESLRKAFFACLIPLVFLIFYGQILLSQNNGKETVKIASVNIGRENIRNVFSGYPDQANEEINDNFLENCRIASRSQAKIVFGNEMMLNVSSENEENFLEKAKAVAIQNSLYIGLPLLVYPEEQAGTYPVNKITWISPDGEIVLSTNKAKPTPGEGDYGDAIIRVFESPYGNISSVICFDMDFPVLMKQAGRLGVDIMLVPGNDWKAITPYHTFVSSFRGMEQGFNLVRSASRGLSAAFDAKGRLLASQNYFQTDDSL
ncbi:hypothetical protein JXR74_00315, partial [Candidatus Mcinerneyibacteriota bacterium]|nr:hypothetical protein [Candidatus Mcinerneyibacteriota bacterium]